MPTTELHVLLAGDRVPTMGQWQAAVGALGLGVLLDVGATPAGSTGFVPAKLRERPAGFEFHVNQAAPLMASYPGLRGMFPTRDRVATFRFGADVVETACAWAALAAFARLSDGAWFDPREGVCWDAGAAEDRARTACSIVAK